MAGGGGAATRPSPLPVANRARVARGATPSAGRPFAGHRGCYGRSLKAQGPSPNPPTYLPDPNPNPLASPHHLNSSPLPSCVRAQLWLAEGSGQAMFKYVAVGGYAWQRGAGASIGVRSFAKKSGYSVRWVLATIKRPQSKDQSLQVT
jgi:hypothetical protein